MQHMDLIWIFFKQINKTNETTENMWTTIQYLFVFMYYEHVSQ